MSTFDGNKSDLEMSYVSISPKNQACTVTIDFRKGSAKTLVFLNKSQWVPLEFIEMATFSENGKWLLLTWIKA